MKTIDIIKEIATHYIHALGQNRGVNKEIKSCQYLTKDGNRCAVGYCINDKYINKLETNALDVTELHTYFSLDTLDDILKERFKEQDIQFWIDLQLWHDSPANWHDEYITLLCKTQLVNLIIEWTDLDLKEAWIAVNEIVDTIPSNKIKNSE